MVGNVADNTILHVNQLVIRGNAKRGERKPPLACRGRKRSTKPEYAHEVDVYHGTHLVGTFVYRPDQPLDCGAKVYFELKSNKAYMVPRVWAEEEVQDERADKHSD
jgi:hypothetical protein